VVQQAASMGAAMDFDSTLIRHGLQATTISDMTRFVATMDQRPLDKLLQDLPGFALFSETKFSLARAVLRRRMKELSAIDREQLRVLASEVVSESKTDVAQRIQAIFE
jgi:hypothetical protein